MAIVAKGGRRISPAGPSGMWPGGQRIYDQGLSAWSAGLGNMAHVLARQDAQIQAAQEATEITARMADYKLGVNKLLDAAAKLQIAGTTDPTKSRIATPQEQQDFFEKGIDALQEQYGAWERTERGRKASEAGRADLQNSMVQETTQAIGQFRAFQRKRAILEVQDQGEHSIKVAIDTDSEPLMRTAVNNMVAADVITEAKGQQIIAEFPVNVKIEQLRRQVQNDPDGVLQQAMALQSGSDVTDKQRSALREVEDLARGVRINNANRQDKWWTAMLEDTLKQAHEIGPTEFQDQLLQTPGLTEVQRAKLMETYLDAARLYQRTGASPWTTTQDYPSLAQALMDVDSGKIKSLKEINETWLKGNKPNWSLNEWRAVKNAFEEKSRPVRDETYSRSHPIAQMYFNKLTSLYATRDSEGNDTVADPQGFATKYMLLEAAFKDPNIWRNPQKMQEEYDGLTKDVKEKEAKKFLDRAFTMPAEEQAAYDQMPYTLAGRGFFVPKYGIGPTGAPNQPPTAKAEPLPTVEIKDVAIVPSHEGAAQLPKGTRYVLPNDRNVYEVP